MGPAKGCDTAGTLKHEYATIRSLDRAAWVPRIVPPLCVSAPRDRACLGYGVSALLPVVRVSGYGARLDGQTWWDPGDGSVMRVACLYRQGWENSLSVTRTVPVRVPRSTPIASIRSYGER